MRGRGNVIRQGRYQVAEFQGHGKISAVTGNMWHLLQTPIDCSVASLMRALVHSHQIVFAVTALVDVNRGVYLPFDRTPLHRPVFAEPLTQSR